MSAILIGAIFKWRFIAYLKFLKNSDKFTKLQIATN